MKQKNCSSNNNIQFKKQWSFINISTAEQKKLIKIKNWILIKELIHFSNKKDRLIIFIDLKTKINIINSVYVI